MLKAYWHWIFPSVDAGFWPLESSFSSNYDLNDFSSGMDLIFSDVR